MKSLAIDKIVCSANAGAALWSCCDEAVVLSMERASNVEFIHDNSIYTVDYKAVLEMVGCSAKPKST